MELIIIDDGTLDTVVHCPRMPHSWSCDETLTIRYDSEFRFSFSNDGEFIESIRGDFENYLEVLNNETQELDQKIAAEE